MQVTHVSHILIILNSRFEVTLRTVWKRRVVSWEISGGNLFQSFWNLLITYANQLFPSLALQSDAAK